MAEGSAGAHLHLLNDCWSVADTISVKQLRAFASRSNYHALTLDREHKRLADDKAGIAFRDGLQVLR
jgi:hypothetical protein